MTVLEHPAEFTVPASQVPSFAPGSPLTLTYSKVFGGDPTDNFLVEIYNAEGKLIATPSISSNVLDSQGNITLAALNFESDTPQRDSSGEVITAFKSASWNGGKLHIQARRRGSNSSGEVAVYLWFAISGAGALEGVSFRLYRQTEISQKQDFNEVGFNFDAAESANRLTKIAQETKSDVDRIDNEVDDLEERTEDLEQGNKEGPGSVRLYIVVKHDDKFLHRPTVSGTPYDSATGAFAPAILAASTLTLDFDTLLFTGLPARTPLPPVADPLGSNIDANYVSGWMNENDPQVIEALNRPTEFDVFYVEYLARPTPRTITLRLMFARKEDRESYAVEATGAPGDIVVRKWVTTAKATAGVSTAEFGARWTARGLVDSVEMVGTETELPKNPLAAISTQNPNAGWVRGQPPQPTSMENMRLMEFTLGIPENVPFVSNISYEMRPRETMARVYSGRPIAQLRAQIQEEAKNPKRVNVFSPEEHGQNLPMPASLWGVANPYRPGLKKSAILVDKMDVGGKLLPGVVFELHFDGSMIYEVQNTTGANALQAPGSGKIETTLHVIFKDADGKEVAHFPEVGSFDFRRGNLASNSLEARWGDRLLLSVGEVVMLTDGTSVTVTEDIVKSIDSIRLELDMEIQTDAGGNAGGTIFRCELEHARANIVQDEISYRTEVKLGDASSFNSPFQVWVFVGVEAGKTAPTFNQITASGVRYEAAAKRVVGGTINYLGGGEALTAKIASAPSNSTDDWYLLVGDVTYDANPPSASLPIVIPNQSLLRYQGKGDATIPFYAYIDEEGAITVPSTETVVAYRGTAQSNPGTVDINIAIDGQVQTARTTFRRNPPTGKKGRLFKLDVVADSSLLPQITGSMNIPLGGMVEIPSGRNADVVVEFVKKFPNTEPLNNIGNANANRIPGWLPPVYDAGQLANQNNVGVAIDVVVDTGVLSVANPDAQEIALGVQLHNDSNDQLLGGWTLRTGEAYPSVNRDSEFLVSVKRTIPFSRFGDIVGDTTKLRGVVKFSMGDIKLESAPKGKKGDTSTLPPTVAKWTDSAVRTNGQVPVVDVDGNFSETAEIPDIEEINNCFAAANNANKEKLSVITPSGNPTIGVKTPLANKKYIGIITRGTRVEVRDNGSQVNVAVPIVESLLEMDSPEDGKILEYEASTKKLKYVDKPVGSQDNKVIRLVRDAYIRPSITTSFSVHGASTASNSIITIPRSVLAIYKMLYFLHGHSATNYSVKRVSGGLLLNFNDPLNASLGMTAILPEFFTHLNLFGSSNDQPIFLNTSVSSSSNTRVILTSSQLRIYCQYSSGDPAIYAIYGFREVLQSA